RTTVVSAPCFSTRTLMRRSLPAVVESAAEREEGLPSRLRVGNGGGEQGAGRGQVSIPQGGARCLDVALSLPGERALRLVQLGLDRVVPSRESLLRDVQRIDGGLHRSALRLLLFLGGLATRFGIRDLLAQLLQLLHQLVELLRILLRLRALLLERVDTRTQLPHLLLDRVDAGVALAGGAAVGRRRRRTKLSRRIGAEQDRAVPRVRLPACFARGRARGLRQQHREEKGDCCEQSHGQNLSRRRRRRRRPVEIEQLADPSLVRAPVAQILESSGQRDVSAQRGELPVEENV